jgi:uncharacterized protein (TIGR02145 family)
VPTKDDFINLDKYFGGDGTNRSVTTSYISTNYIKSWGAVYGGMSNGSLYYGTVDHAYYWTTDEVDDEAYRMDIWSEGHVNPSYLTTKSLGMQVRCVSVK